MILESNAIPPVWESESSACVWPNVERGLNSHWSIIRCHLSAERQFKLNFNSRLHLPRIVEQQLRMEIHVDADVIQLLEDFGGGTIRHFTRPDELAMLFTSALLPRYQVQVDGSVRIGPGSRSDSANPSVWKTGPIFCQVDESDTLEGFRCGWVQVVAWYFQIDRFAWNDEHFPPFSCFQIPVTFCLPHNQATTWPRTNRKTQVKATLMSCRP